MERPRRRPAGVKNFLQKTLILAFEVIVQPPKHTFEIGFFFRVLAHCAKRDFFALSRQNHNNFADMYIIHKVR